MQSEAQRAALQKHNDSQRKIKNPQEVIDLYLSGKSCNEIKRIFGCSKNPVLKALKGIPKRKCWEYPQHRSHNQLGEKNTSWKGGIKDVYNRFRDLSEYYEWRKSVLKRDNNKCTSCRSTEKLQSHHLTTLKSLINQYCVNNKKQIKELTREDLLSSFFYDLSNGLTLCEDCHKKWHKEHGR